VAWKLGCAFHNDASAGADAPCPASAGRYGNRYAEETEREPIVMSSKTTSVNSKKPLYQVPVPSVEFKGDATLCENVLSFQYYKDKSLYRGGIKFNRVAATRTRAERCCLSWHIDDAYDTLVEVEGSSWLREIRADTEEMWRDKWEMHHYMIYLDSAGCFEWIAESWEPLQEQSHS
jgi:hypothetical protein